MASPSPALSSRKGRWLTPARVVAIDPGAHSLKLALLEIRGSGVRLLRAEAIDLQEEGLLSHEESARHLQELLHELGDYPVAMSIPQHVALSQVIDLPQVSEDQIHQVIEGEAVKLSGLSESAIDHGYMRLRPYARHQNPFWVTLCQEAEVYGRIDRLQLATRELCEVTTAANALIGGYLHLRPEADHTVLVDLGASGTVVTILLEGQGIFAATFTTGGDFLTQAIASQMGCAPETAEVLKRSRNLFEGEDALPRFELTVKGWVSELKRTVQEWLEENPQAGALGDFEFILGGGGALQPGLMEFLRRSSGLSFNGWPEDGEGTLSPQFAVAYGTALQALGQSPVTVSLLPVEIRVSSDRRRHVRQWQSLNIMFLTVVFIAMLAATWQKMMLASHKQELIQEADRAHEKAVATESLARQVMLGYGHINPILQQQKRTLDTLETLSLLQQVRTNLNLWFVLFADQKTYFTYPIVTSTNGTNVAEITIPSTNIVAFKPGFVAELSLLEEGEPMRRTLSQVVTNLKTAPLFSNVDILSDDRRRSIISSNLVLAGRNFAVAMELADSGLSPALRIREPAAIERDNRRAVRPTLRALERSPASNGNGSTPANGSPKPEGAK